MVLSETGNGISATRSWARRQVRASIELKDQKLKHLLTSCNVVMRRAFDFEALKDKIVKRKIS